MQYVNSLQDPCQHIVKGVDGRLSRRILLLLYYWYQCVLFWTCARFSPAPVGLFSCSQLRGTQGTRLYTTAQVWVSGELCGACSGRSKSRNLASNHGVAFHGARSEQDNRKPAHQLYCSTAVKGNNTLTTIALSFPRSYHYGHYYARVHQLCRVWS